MKISESQVVEEQVSKTDSSAAEQSTPTENIGYTETLKKTNPINRFLVSIPIILLFVLSVVYFSSKSGNSIFESIGDQSENKSRQTTPTTVANALPTPVVDTSTTSTTNAPLADEKTIDVLSVDASIKVPFVREGSIFLYEDGQEKRVAKPSQESTGNSCFHLQYPLISPNGKYIAYIEQVGGSPSYGGCTTGVLRVVDVSASIIKATEYETSTSNIYSWNNQNQLLLEASLPDNKVKYAIYDPSSGAELASETLDYMQRDAGYRGYPLYSPQKIIRYKDRKYYLVNQDTGVETLLIEGEDIDVFRGWSPDGKYALFDTRKTAPKHERAFSGIWLAVNTDNPNEQHREVFVLFGAAGGDFSTGNKWYFNKAFFGYCSEHLVFIDGSDPIELTNSGGGGCNNEEGFVATSPSGKYAFVKFADRFELHTVEGQKQVVNEATKLSKGRGFPKNLIWLDDDNMIMFERVYSGDTYGEQEPPKIHIYNRQTNTLKPLISDAYLLEQ